MLQIVSARVLPERHLGRCSVNFTITPCTLSPVEATKLSAYFDMETISYQRNDRKFLKYLRNLKINRGKYYCVVKLLTEFGTSVTFRQSL